MHLEPALIVIKVMTNTCAGMEDRTLDPLGEHLIENCAKLKLLDKLLPKLQAKGSRVLIFSQVRRTWLCGLHCDGRWRFFMQ